MLHQKFMINLHCKSSKAILTATSAATALGAICVIQITIMDLNAELNIQLGSWIEICQDYVEYSEVSLVF